MDKATLSTFQHELLQMKEDIERRFKQNEHFGLENGHPHETVGELSSYDNHPADEGTELFEREKDIALNEHLEFEYAEINAALDRIDNGTYGTCSVCGKEINLERLEALPTAYTCQNHSPKKIVTHSRPVEEEVLHPTLNQFNFDDQDVEAMDGEDFYQEVARYGTSETPQDFISPSDSYSETYNEADEPIGYVEEYENFVGTDIEGKNVQVYLTNEHKRYEQLLDDNETMTPFGDLPANEKEPYVSRKKGSNT
ncbi:TraR/DksA C4-type zinc finger protein [Bacillus kexueae]|uniref:TraR/DksA C4-type zinc finger protein n=1 Tax=Aeribacillus kexueae TaxID=2078952 RepID=UPI001FAEF14F|nr:TraR/DksA C4-type zinc finger protein [Bacillus kexueae]